MQIRLELTARDAGDLGADAAQVLGLAAVRDLVAVVSLLACEITNAGPCAVLKKRVEEDRGHGVVFQARQGNSD